MKTTHSPTVHLPIDLKTLSHELRTPLTGILGMAELLHDEPLTPQQQCYVDDIRQAGDNLLRVINLLLYKTKQVKPGLH